MIWYFVSMTVLPAKWGDPDLYPDMIREVQDIPCIWQRNVMKEEKKVMRKAKKQVNKRTKNQRNNYKKKK